MNYSLVLETYLRFGNTHKNRRQLWTNIWIENKFLKKKKKYIKNIMKDKINLQKKKKIKKKNDKKKER